MDRLIEPIDRHDRMMKLACALLYLGVAAGVLGLVFLELGRGYNYASEWDQTRYAFTSSNFRLWTALTDFSQICFLLIIPIISALKRTKLVLVQLTAAGGFIIYSVIELFGQGTSPLDALFGSASTIVFLIPLFFVLGFDSDFLRTIRRIAPWLALLYLSLAAWSVLNFYATCGWGSKIGWYPAREFFASAICFCWFTGLGCFGDGRMNSYAFKITLASALAVLGILLLVRSWVIQALLLAIAVTIIQQDGSKTTRRVVLVGMGAVAVFVIVSIAFPTVLESFIGRAGEDTRSGQYDTFFSQVDPSSLIFGNGYSASYVYGDNQNYTQFDNQFIYTAFHYGIIPTLVYLLVVLTAIASGWGGRHRSPQAIGASIAGTLHLAATVGLSTYFSYTISPGIVFLFALLGEAMNESDFAMRGQVFNAYGRRLRPLDASQSQ